MKQVIVLFVSLNLLTTTASLPASAADTPFLAGHNEQSSSFFGSRVASENLVTHSAAIGGQPRFQYRSEEGGSNRSAAPRKLEAPVLSSDKRKPRVAPPVGLESLVQAKLRGRVTIFGRHGLTFIENRGQFDERVKMQLKGNGRTAWLTNTGIVFDFLRSKASRNHSEGSDSKTKRSRYETLEVGPRSPIGSPRLEDMERLVVFQDFVGAKQSPTIEAKNPQAGTYNYLVGSDPTKWRTDVRGYAEVIYRDIWKGVDLRLYGKGPDVEQEFIVRPGADVAQVRIAYRGIQGLEVARDGSLVVRTEYGELRESKPRIYQEITGRRLPVKRRFKLAKLPTRSR